MYDYIKGKLVSQNIRNGCSIVVECNNIGYLINTPERVIHSLDEQQDNVKIYLSLIHKEDSMSLCGFLTKEDRDIFNILQSVSGVGVKSSLVLLNEFSGCELINAVINEDDTLLSRAKGIGAKLAKKIIIELKDKLINLQNIEVLSKEIDNVTILSDSIRKEAAAVLLSLGYTSEEIKKSVKYVLNNTECKNSEDLLKYSLQYLSSNY